VFSNRHAQAGTFSSHDTATSHPTSHLTRFCTQPSAVLSSRNTGKLEKLSSMNDMVTAQLNALCASEEAAGATRTLLVAAMTKAVCYVMRDRARAARNFEGGTESRESARDERILVLSATPSLHDQYIQVMNCIFAAQKQGVLIDACVVRETSALLQQAAALTGGV